MCRAPCALAPEPPTSAPRLPRFLNPSPFTPNRTADAVIRDSITRLERIITNRCIGSDRDIDEDGPSIHGWVKNGSARKDWDARDLEGRREMGYLISRWGTLQPEDLIEMKDRLKV